MRDVIERTWGWNDDWQRRDFDRRFSTYLASVIEVDGQAVGGLLLDSKEETLDIVEVQVLPEHQCNGIGTSVVERVVQDGVRRGLAVTLSVVPANARAKQLYEQLGFHVTAFTTHSFACDMVHKLRFDVTASTLDEGGVS